MSIELRASSLLPNKEVKLFPEENLTDVLENGELDLLTWLSGVQISVPAKENAARSATILDIEGHRYNRLKDGERVDLRFTTRYEWEGYEIYLWADVATTWNRKAGTYLLAGGKIEVDYVLQRNQRISTTSGLGKAISLLFTTNSRLVSYGICLAGTPKTMQEE